MPKAPSGGGGGATLFASKIIGPLPGPLSAGTNDWIELGSVPTGNKVWFGIGQYGSPEKSITFELRTNLTGQSTGADASTALLASVAVAPRNGTVVADYYKKGTLHTATVVGTGVEKFWLRLKAKAGSGSYLYTITYTLE